MNNQTQNPLISIIIPCFNNARFLSETLNSVLDQTYKNWECIVINDGSSDKPEQVVEKFLLMDNRFRYIVQENRGPAIARNLGIKNSKGEYIQFLDADDLIAPEKIEKQMKCFENNPSVDIVYSEYQCFDDGNREHRWIYSRVKLNDNVVEDFAKQWEKELSIPIHCFLYKRQCFDKWGLFDESFKSGREDWDLHLKFAYSNAKYFFVDGITSFYRVVQDSLARDIKKGRVSRSELLKKYMFKREIPFNIRLIFMKRYLEVNPLLTFFGYFFKKYL